MANKSIALQEGLHEAAKLLKENGYHVTAIDEAEKPIDAIVYSNRNHDYLAHNTTGKIMVPSYNKFVKMINIDEIGINNLIRAIEEIN